MIVRSSPRSSQSHEDGRASLGPDAAGLAAQPFSVDGRLEGVPGGLPELRVGRRGRDEDALDVANEVGQQSPDAVVVTVAVVVLRHGVVSNGRRRRCYGTAGCST